MFAKQAHWRRAAQSRACAAILLLRRRDQVMLTQYGKEIAIFHRAVCAAELEICEMKIPIVSGDGVGIDRREFLFEPKDCPKFRTTLLDALKHADA